MLVVYFKQSFYLERTIWVYSITLIRIGHLQAFAQVLVLTCQRQRANFGEKTADLKKWSDYLLCSEHMERLCTKAFEKTTLDKDVIHSNELMNQYFSILFDFFLEIRLLQCYWCVKLLFPKSSFLFVGISILLLTFAKFCSARHDRVHTCTCVWTFLSNIIYLDK